MLKKLRLKFICINMAIVTAMLCVIFGTVYYFTSRNLETDSLQMMQAVASGPQLPGRPGELPDNVNLPYFSVQQGPHGELLVSDTGYFDLSDEDYVREVVAAAEAAGGQSGVLKQYGLRFCYVQSIPFKSLVFADISSERATLSNLVRTCVLIGFASFLVFSALSVFLARWAVRPVETAWAQQKQFVADASHELKTPLTVILTNAELLHDPACPASARAHSANSILTMAHQMRGLVEGLLELARVDNGAVKTAFSELEYSDLVGDALLPFEPLFFEKGLFLRSTITPGLTLRGSAQHLHQTVEILLDNALKYAAPASAVQLKLSRQGQHALLSVASCGDTISRDDLKNIFRRFYRIDKARSASSSYGLGLSIAERIVTEHGGRIWAESENGVNTFFVQLPL